MTGRAQKIVLMNAELEIQRATTSTNTPIDEQFQLWINTVPSKLDHVSRFTIRIVDEVIEELQEEYFRQAVGYALAGFAGIRHLCID